MKQKFPRIFDIIEEKISNICPFIYFLKFSMIMFFFTVTALVK